MYQKWNYWIVRSFYVSFSWETIKVFPRVVAPVYISTSDALGFQFLHALITSYYFLVLDPRHPRGCAVVSCGCDLFPWWPVMLSIFSWAIDHLYIFPGEMSSQTPCPLLTGLLVFLLLSCKGSSDIPDISFLSEIWFAIIFSHFANCHFIRLGILWPPQILVTSSFRIFLSLSMAS